MSQPNATPAANLSSPSPTVPPIQSCSWQVFRRLALKQDNNEVIQYALVTVQPATILYSGRASTTALN